MTPSGIKQSGKAEVIRSQLDDSLNRLGVEYIDLYYQVSDMITFGNWYNLIEKDYYVNIDCDIENEMILSSYIFICCNYHDRPLWKSIKHKTLCKDYCFDDSKILVILSEIQFNFAALNNTPWHFYTAHFSSTIWGNNKDCVFWFIWFILYILSFFPCLYSLDNWWCLLVFALFFYLLWTLNTKNYSKKYKN